MDSGVRVQFKIKDMALSLRGGSFGTVSSWAVGLSCGVLNTFFVCLRLYFCLCEECMCLFVSVPRCGCL